MAVHHNDSYVVCADGAAVGQAGADPLRVPAPAAGKTPPSPCSATSTTSTAGTGPGHDPGSARRRHAGRDPLGRARKRARAGRGRLLVAGPEAARPALIDEFRASPGISSESQNDSPSGSPGFDSTVRFCGLLGGDYVGNSWGEVSVFDRPA